MIDQVYQMGLEKYAGDEAAAQAFTQGFMKQAFLGLDPATIATKASEGVGKGLAAAGIGAAVYGVSAMMNSSRNSALRTKADASFQRAIQTNQILKNADPAKVRSYFETVFKFSPHVAADPNLLSSILSNAVLGEGIDPMTIKTLVELEGRAIGNAKDALFTPKAFG